MTFLSKCLPLGMQSFQALLLLNYFCSTQMPLRMLHRPKRPAQCTRCELLHSRKGRYSDAPRNVSLGEAYCDDFTFK